MKKRTSTAQQAGLQWIPLENSGESQSSIPAASPKSGKPCRVLTFRNLSASLVSSGAPGISTVNVNRM